MKRGVVLLALALTAAADPPPILLAVDATDVAHGIVSVTETLPVDRAGSLTLRYPRWIPGTHRPSGPIARLAGLHFNQAGQAVVWRRDALDPYSFHLDLRSTAPLVASFRYLSPTDGGQGDVTMTPAMTILSWHTVSLYPADRSAATIRVRASVTFPTGWRSATALAPGSAGDRMTYPVVAYATLIDSPVLAARHMRSETLVPGIRLDIAADRPSQLAATPEQIAAHRRMIAQALTVFGRPPFDHYDFLMWLSDTMDGQGLEHRRSSENGVPAGYFADWPRMAARRNMLAHEFTHAWNGKFRLPTGLVTPDFAQPLIGEGLWLYEGQTRFWDYVLQARSGLVSRQDTLDGLARIAAFYATAPAFDWRSIGDTTADVLMADGRGWNDYQGSSDYYEAGKLVWLEADQLIRERSGGRRSLDDVARRFFASDGDPQRIVPYTRADVIAALDAVQPHDWAGFLRTHIDTIGRPPLEWIARGGYRLTFVATPPAYWRSIEHRAGAIDLRHSIGLAIGPGGSVRDVAWDGPAFRAGLAPGATILRIGDSPYSDDALLATIAARRPLRLAIRQQGEERTVAISWTGGLRYPTLIRTGTAPAGLDAMLEPR